jgi:hypothetical protein
MQEIKKRRIVIASVLKPVDETRMFEKIAQSLASLHEVHVIGSAPATDYPSQIPQHSLGRFSRLSFRRIVAAWKVAAIALRLKPDLFIICTHELLLPALLVRLITGGRIWYDVQENYVRNILHTNAFPLPMRPFVAAYVWIKERMLSPIIERYLLAEVAYAEEMPYLAERAVPIENKFKPKGPLHLPEARKANGFRVRGKKLLFTGTLAESTGVYVAIDVATALHQLDSEITLLIVGFAAADKDQRKLEALARDRSFITLLGVRAPVSHDVIVKNIVEADFGFITYPPNKATENAIPTKLYEYLAHRMPILLTRHPRWEAICSKFQAACVFSPVDLDPEDLLPNMYSQSFYTAEVQGVQWETEQARLLQLV